MEALAARLYPREDYLKSRHMFEDLIVAFNRNVNAQYGVPRNNLATGMAVALAGGYAAYTNQAFPDAMVKPLVTQLDGLLRDGLLREDSKVTSMGIRQKVYTYHMMVGTGLWLTAMQIDLQRQPNARHAAALRRAGATTCRPCWGWHRIACRSPRRGSRCSECAGSSGRGRAQLKHKGHEAYETS